MVQHEMKRRKESVGHHSGTSCFSSKIICGECGNFYGSKVWHSTSKYRRTIWQCNHKFKNNEKCKTPHLYEDEIKEAFLKAFNQLLTNKDEIIENCETIKQVLIDTCDLDAEADKLQGELAMVTETIHKSIEINAHTEMDQAEYQECYNSLRDRYEKIKNKIDKIEEKRAEHRDKHEKIDLFISTLKNKEYVLTEFDEELWFAVVDNVIVCSGNDIKITFRD